jgi:hypothetical protein
MFSKSDAKRHNRTSPAAKKADLAGQLNFVKGAYTVKAADVTATKVALTITGFSATGMIAHMVSATDVPVTLTSEKFAVSSGNTALEFKTTTLAAGQKIFYLLW